ncbi:4'-phosphopantetheinyl transferase [Vibrio vulnificus]
MMQSAADKFIEEWAPFPLQFYGVEGAMVQFNPIAVSERDFDAHNVRIPKDYSKMVSSRRSEFLAARLCAQSILSRFDTIESNQVEVGLCRSPIWPSGVLGSISHSGNIAAACVVEQSQFRNIGIDVEPLIEPSIIDRIGRNVMTEFEHAKWAAYHSDEIQRSRFFTLIYSCKESIFKALFKDVNKIFDFDSVSLVSLDENKAVFRLDKTLNLMWQKGELLVCYYKFVSSLVFTIILVT